ncbi:MAG TPA: prepilin-type N-terminal cleavage/methylation domain-containing protein [bacterium]|nr:prepilin-type N-terminal cleavage/methylation domain-containing protein [bacterium]
MLQFFSRRLRNERGFTLIELLIVVAIIAILAAILIPNFLRARAQSQVAATKGNLKNVATALESYQVDFSVYPSNANDLVTGGYTRALPSDPCTGTAFGVSPGYLYTPIGTPATDYELKTRWGTTAGAAGFQCYQANQNSNIAYTPGGGLQQTP